MAKKLHMGYRLEPELKRAWVMHLGKYGLKAQSVIEGWIRETVSGDDGQGKKMPRGRRRPRMASAEE